MANRSLEDMQTTPDSTTQQLNRAQLVRLRTAFIHCFFFIYGRKIYVCTHVKKPDSGSPF